MGDRVNARQTSAGGVLFSSEQRVKKPENHRVIYGKWNHSAEVLFTSH
jgi:hypothetical protein